MVAEIKSESEKFPFGRFEKNHAVAENEERGQ